MPKLDGFWLAEQIKTRAELTGERFDIAASHEMRACTSEDDAAKTVIGSELRRMRDQRIDHRQVERIEPRHAHELGHAVDLGGARAALAGLAVPADGQVGSLRGLQPMDDVEDDLALVDLDLVVGEFPGARVPAPDPQRHLVAHQCFSSAWA